MTGLNSAIITLRKREGWTMYSFLRFFLYLTKEGEVEEGRRGEGAREERWCERETVEV